MANNVEASASMGRGTRKVLHGPDLVGIPVLDAGFSEPQSQAGFEGHGSATACGLQRSLRGQREWRLVVVLVAEERLDRQCQPQGGDADVCPGSHSDHAGGANNASVA